MEFPKREPALPQGSPRRSPKATRPAAATEGDENASSKRPVPACAAVPPQRKKVLGQRNDGGGVGGTEANASPQPKPKPAPSPPTLAGRGAGPYDPKTNYTTPRPEFLRYDPERRREILLRVARAAEVEFDDCSSTASGTAASEDDGGSVSSDAAVASPVSSARTSDSKAELDDGSEGEEEEEVAPARRGRWARRLFLLLVAVACSLCYIYCMNPTAFPVYSEDDIDLVGTVGGLYDDGDHALDSLRLLEPVFMMDPEGVLEDTATQTVLQHNQGVSPRYMVAVTIMGLADVCLNVPLGEFTCQISGESRENVSDLKEDSELDELDAAIESFMNGEQIREVGCSGGTIELDSIASTSTHSADMEEGCSGLVHQEEGEAHSVQLVSMETASDKLVDRMGLEIQELNLWQYENTADAAKAICSTVKFLWSAMEPHFFQISVWLSVAGMVAALFICYQRSRHNAAPPSQHVNSRSHGEVPALVPHQFVQLPVPASPQAVQLLGLTVPNQAFHLSPRFKVPMDAVQKSLPKSDPFVSPNAATVDHGEADNMKASNGYFLNHRDVDSSKPPVVERLGEFTFANNSSIGRSIKRLNQYAGDATVQELPERLKKDVDKMQMDFSIVRSPIVRRERTEENPVKGEKIPASVTPTPLRRSNPPPQQADHSLSKAALQPG